MNKYLEKIASEGLVKQALNAQKAREMAKKVGVIADPDSNWKYALRNLRDGRGNPLEGQAKREAINRLAGGRDIHREHQQMLGMQRKARDVDEIQFVTSRGNTLYKEPVLGAGNLDELSRIRDTLSSAAEDQAIRLQNTALPLFSHGNPAQLAMSHTHPNFSRKVPILQRNLRNAVESQGVAIKEGIDPRRIPDDLISRLSQERKAAGAVPSGSHSQMDAFRHMGKAERNRVITSDPHLNASVESYRAGDYDGYMENIGKFHARTPSFSYAQRGARYIPEGGDTAAFSVSYANQVNPIHSPSTGVVGLHKATTGGKGSPVYQGTRSVYLDLSPRKTRN